MEAKERILQVGGKRHTELNVAEKSVAVRIGTLQTDLARRRQ